MICILYRRYRIALLVLSLNCCVAVQLFAQNTQTEGKDSLKTERSDSLKPKIRVDSIMNQNMAALTNMLSGKAFAPGFKRYNLDSNIGKNEFASLQQIAKGRIAGLYVQEPTGEPGTQQPMFVRGLSYPLLNSTSLLNNQPVVYLNGIPLITSNALEQKIERYDNYGIGPQTNLYSIISSDNIESIEVLKDAWALAKLGPLAANGAIFVKTKGAHSGKSQIEVNSYIGYNRKPNIHTINAKWENDFRDLFYDKYPTKGDKVNKPIFLRDSTNASYYGPSNWVDDYYDSKPFYAVDFSLAGGTERANFKFEGNHKESLGIADGTNLKQYGAAFYINMAPIKWLSISSMINANRLQRSRNKNIADRYAETGYAIDLSNPLPSNKDLYGQYLGYFSAQIDDNKTNSAQGYLMLSAGLGKLKINSKLAVDYNEGIRRIFWPSTLMEKNNYLSSYFGYNQRVLLDNSASYQIDFHNKSKLNFNVGQTLVMDQRKYEYSYGYNTPNDYIKINTDTSNTGMNPYMFMYSDRMNYKLSSLYGYANYDFLNDAANAFVSTRQDGYSGYPASNRWHLTYMAGFSLDLLKVLHKDGGALLSKMEINASGGTIGQLDYSGMYAYGPQYISYMGWGKEVDVPSYLGMAGLMRPYQSGWIGYNIPWTINTKYNVGANIGLLNNLIQLSVDAYQNTNKDQVLPITAPSQSGYKSVYSSGMKVRNQGIEIGIMGKILSNPKGWSWDVKGNASWNQNKLLALPGGISSVVIGSQKLVVGKPIDQFWVYENQGIYSAASDIPIVNGSPLTYDGVPFEVGDARWKDNNGDGIVNENDKVLKGHYMPTMYGGFGSDLSYKNISLCFDFVYELGRSVLNQKDQSRLDFVNVESSNNIDAVKEITFWEKPFDINKYPIYNVWSPTLPYRLDQDLFVQKASFLQLRTVTLGYDFHDLKLVKKANFYRATLYMSGMNLWKASPFKNGDPETANYNGIYTGNNMRIPMSFVLGVKLGF
ncbi:MULTISPECIES: TonB-dependent receptor plug domain-containing protein [Chitinophagaceae]